MASDLSCAKTGTMKAEAAQWTDLLAWARAFPEMHAAALPNGGFDPFMSIGDGEFHGLSLRSAGRTS